MRDHQTEASELGDFTTTPRVLAISLLPVGIGFVLVVHRMADRGPTRFPVVERGPGRKLLGMIALDDLLKARVRNLDAEPRRERVLRLRFPFVLGRR